MDELFVISGLSMMQITQKEIFGERNFEFAKKVDETLGNLYNYKPYIIKYNGEVVTALTNLIKGCPIIMNKEYEVSGGGIVMDPDLPETYVGDLEDFKDKDKVKELIKEYNM